MAAGRKIILASVMGNALEFYDFTLYGVLASVLAGYYFPGGDETAKLLCSLAAFAVGFLTRPMGALLFGYVGDRFGRREALSMSILLMGVPTFLIGIAPSYAEIGIAASVLVFVCRLLQGVFTGGEYNGAAIFSIEHLGKRYPGMVGGMITGSCVIGAIGATMLGAWSQSPGMPPWSWRIPFLFGGVLGVFGYFMRQRMAETPEFAALKEQSKMSLVNVLSTYPRSSLLSFVLGSFNGALSYTLFGFFNIYLSRYMKLPLAEAIRYNLIGLGCFLVGSPLLGYVFDVVGQRQFLIGATAGIFSLAAPIFMLLGMKTFGAIALAQALFGFCTASIAGTGHAVMQKLFPVGERYRGVAFNFSLGMGIFGGITPMIYVHMIERSHASLLFPAFFLMGFAVVFSSIYAGLQLRRKDVLLT